MIQRFADILSELDDTIGESLRRAAHDGGLGKVDVAVSRPLSWTERCQLDELISEVLQRDVYVDVQVSRDLLAGIQMSVEGITVGWSLASGEERQPQAERGAMRAAAIDVAPRAAAMEVRMSE